MKRIFNLLMLLVATTLLTSCGTDNDPGTISMYYNSWGSGVDTTRVYQEGFHGHMPWAEHIQYNGRNQTIPFESEVMDKNGTSITIVAKVNFAVIPNKIARLNSVHGETYQQSFINPKVLGAIKDVAGRYTYEELYSLKREALETEIETLLEEDFTRNYLHLAFVEVADVNLPKSISEEIVRTETQKKRNLTSALKEKEQVNLAAAKEAEAEGNKRRDILNAEAEAQAITIKNKALSQSPKYIELIDAEARLQLAKNIKGLGTGNVFGADSNIVKLLGSK